jgi:hypothetical protein
MVSVLSGYPASYIGNRRVYVIIMDLLFGEEAACFLVKDSDQVFSRMHVTGLPPWSPGSVHQDQQKAGVISGGNWAGLNSGI